MATPASANVISSGKTLNDTQLDGSCQSFTKGLGDGPVPKTPESDTNIVGAEGPGHYGPWK